MIKYLMVCLGLAGVIFAQSSTDVLEYKIKYEDSLKKQISEILNMTAGKDNFAVTVTVDISPTSEKLTRRIARTEMPEGVDPTLWSLAGKEKSEAEEKIIETKHKITKVSAAVLLSDVIDEEQAAEIKDGIIKSIKDLDKNGLDVKRQKFAAPVEAGRFFENNKKTLMFAVVILAGIIFLFGPLRSFLKSLGDPGIGRRDSSVSVEMKGGAERADAGTPYGTPITQGRGEQVKAGLPSGTTIETKQEKGHFAFIKKSNLKNLAYILQDEPADMISLVLSYLNEGDAADVMRALPKELQTKAAVAMSEVKQATEENVTAAEEKIKRKIGYLVGGLDRFTGIMEQLDKDSREEILGSLEKESSELAGKIKKGIFSFENITALEDAELQAVLRAVKPESLAKALVNAPAGLTEKIRKNISAGAYELLREEMLLASALGGRKIEEERKKIVELIKEFEKQGKVRINREKFTAGKVSELDITEKKVTLADYENVESRKTMSLRKVFKLKDRQETEKLFVPEKKNDGKDKN